MHGHKYLWFHDDQGLHHELHDIGEVPLLANAKLSSGKVVLRPVENRPISKASEPGFTQTLQMLLVSKAKLFVKVKDGEGIFSFTPVEPGKAAVTRWLWPSAMLAAGRSC